MVSAADPFLPGACERAGRFPIVLLDRSQLYSRSFLRLVAPGRTRTTTRPPITLTTTRESSRIPPPAYLPRCETIRLSEDVHHAGSSPVSYRTPFMKGSADERPSFR